MMLDALCSSSTVSEESHSMGCCCGEICCLSCSCAIFFFTISLLKRWLHCSVIQLFIFWMSLSHAFYFTTILFASYDRRRIQNKKLDDTTQAQPPKSNLRLSALFKGKVMIRLPKYLSSSYLRLHTLK